ncbi:MAG: CoxG family protein [Candidatus Limnocylindrales bacterium]
MQFSGTVQIAAPRERVWAFLMDPNRVGSCGPGVESVEVIDADRFKAKARVGIGFIAARFTVDMTIAERAEPDHALIKAHGQAPGSAVDATADMTLDGPAEGPTTMTWSADVSIAGKLASVGGRMIDGTANKMIGQTFDCIRSKLEAG